MPRNTPLPDPATWPGTFPEFCSTALIAAERQLRSGDRDRVVADQLRWWGQPAIQRRLDVRFPKHRPVLLLRKHFEGLRPA